jgi:hypothetical protein
LATRLTAVVLAAAVLSGCERTSATFNVTAASSASPREKGKKEATDALAAGTLKLKEFPPLPSPAWHGNYIRLLKERGIDYEVPPLPKGVPEADFIEEIKGWNEVVTAEIEKRLGKNILGQLHDEAKAMWENKK